MNESLRDHEYPIRAKREGWEAIAADPELWEASVLEVEQVRHVVVTLEVGGPTTYVDCTLYDDGTPRSMVLHSSWGVPDSCELHDDDELWARVAETVKLL